MPIDTIIKPTQNQKIPDNKLINNEKKNASPYLLASNPIVDSLGWGALGAAAGAGYSVYSQKKLFKNQENLDRVISSITESITNAKANNKNTFTLEKALECLKNKKLNWRSVKNWGIAIGLLAFLPQLLINSLYWTGQKGYNKIKESQAEN